MSFLRVRVRVRLFRFITLSTTWKYLQKSGNFFVLVIFFFLFLNVLLFDKLLLYETSFFKFQVFLISVYDITVRLVLQKRQKDILSKRIITKRYRHWYYHKITNL